MNSALGVFSMCSASEGGTLLLALLEVRLELRGHGRRVFRVIDCIKGTLVDRAGRRWGYLWKSLENLVIKTEILSPIPPHK